MNVSIRHYWQQLSILCVTLLITGRKIVWHLVIIKFVLYSELYLFRILFILLEVVMHQQVVSQMLFLNMMLKLICGEHVIQWKLHGIKDFLLYFIFIVILFHSESILQLLFLIQKYMHLVEKVLKVRLFKLLKLMIQRLIDGKK